MKLKSLELIHFKGVDYFKMMPAGENVTIFGDNELGKTTIADSLPWLFYDLDSMGKIFNPKPLDLTGEAAHGIESIVEAIFIFDDGADDLTLKKSFCENWTKKHGTGKKVFEGHTTTYYIDDMEVSVRKKDYDERIGKIARSTILKLLTSTRFFAEGEQKTKRKDDPNRWDWEKRRELLFELSDNMPTDEDIILANPVLSRMTEILNGKSAEKRKAIIKERQKGLNRLINEIPISIKERKRDMPDISGLDLPTIEKELLEALTLKNKEALRIESGGEIAEKIKKQREIESELLEIENRITKERNRLEKIQRKQISDLETAREDEESARGKILIVIENREETNKLAEKKMAKLRANWNAVNKSIFDELSTLCPTCGTDLKKYPTKKTQEIKEIFHTKKAETLANINQSGRAIVIDIIARKDLNETDQADVSLYEEKIEELTKQIDIDKVKSQVLEEEKPAEKDKEQEALELDLTEIKMNINGLRANSHEATEKVKAEIEALSEKQTAENLKKQTLESHAGIEKRITELGQQQKKAAGEFESLEEHLFILNEFTKTKARMVEGKISEKFTITNFKLFNIQVNGEVDDCCEAKHQGIEWGKGLNFSSRKNVGVDCINTLSKHFGLTMPLFLDDMNLVTKLIPTESQIIKLVVSETVQCAECDWTGLHSETNKELDDDNIIIAETCPKCGRAIKEYKGLVVRER